MCFYMLVKHSLCGCTTTELAKVCRTARRNGYQCVFRAPALLPWDHPYHDLARVLDEVSDREFERKVKRIQGKGQENSQEGDQEDNQENNQGQSWENSQKDGEGNDQENGQDRGEEKTQENDQDSVEEVTAISEELNEARKERENKPRRCMLLPGQEKKIMMNRCAFCEEDFIESWGERIRAAGEIWVD